MAEFKPLTNKKRVPCCPNHGEPLDGVGYPIPRKGEGICPVSGAHFDFEISLDQESVEYEKDHAGNLKPVPQYRVNGDES